MNRGSLNDKSLGCTGQTHRLLDGEPTGTCIPPEGPWYPEHLHEPKVETFRSWPGIFQSSSCGIVPSAYRVSRSFSCLPFDSYLQCDMVT